MTLDVSFTWTRTGAHATVSDVVGTRTFAYNGALQLESESTGGASLMHGKLIERTYQSGSGGTGKGRYNGLRGTSGGPPCDYSTIYWHDSRGRSWYFTTAGGG